MINTRHQQRSTRRLHDGPLGQQHVSFGSPKLAFILVPAVGENKDLIVANEGNMPWCMIFDHIALP
jgi:hypothetical protein